MGIDNPVKKKSFIISISTQHDPVFISAFGMKTPISSDLQNAREYLLNRDFFRTSYWNTRKALKLFPKTDCLLGEAIKAYLRVEDTDKALELLERLKKFLQKTVSI